MLSIKEIKELIELVSEKNLAGIEIERAGFRLRIDGHRPDAAGLPTPLYYPSFPEARAAGAALPAPEAKREPEPPPAPEESLHVIVSPIVGTFYRSASPESAPFVSPGDKVQKGKILCIIEAMKLMNEIESDAAGEIVEVYPQNGQPVEYGEKLFAIRTA